MRGFGRLRSCEAVAEQGLSILSDPAAMGQVRESEQAIAAGEASSSLADLEAQLARRRDTWA